MTYPMFLEQMVSDFSMTLLLLNNLIMTFKQHSKQKNLQNGVNGLAPYLMFSRVLHCGILRCSSFLLCFLYIFFSCSSVVLRVLAL